MDPFSSSMPIAWSKGRMFEQSILMTSASPKPITIRFPSAFLLAQGKPIAGLSCPTVDYLRPREVAAGRCRRASFWLIKCTVQCHQLKCLRVNVIDFRLTLGFTDHYASGTWCPFMNGGRIAHSFTLHIHRTFPSTGTCPLVQFIVPLAEEAWLQTAVAERWLRGEHQQLWPSFTEP